MVRPLTSLMLLAALSAASTDAAHVHPRVHRALQEQGTVNLMVTLSESPERVLQELEARDAAERRLATGNSTTSKWDIVRRGIRIKSLMDALKKHHNETAKPVEAVIQEHTASTPLFNTTRRFWMTNQLFFRNATGEFVEKLVNTPGIKDLREEVRFKLPHVLTVDALVDGGLAVNVSVDASLAQWGVKKIGATTAWDNGTTGQGVVMGFIDTGVLATHETLHANFRGAANYGWFDPEKKAATPYDPQGHGTAVTSLAVGAKGYGVAPGATWMACKACRDDDCPEADILSCLQWMLCPTDVNGENPDCSKAPHIINNSWGADEVDWSYQTAIRSWVTAGIIPVFANGNSGPACGTVNYPAAYPEVISVGASRSDDAVAPVSSKGPSADGTIKPDIIAPGYSVQSAWGDADDSYATNQGTSLSAPYTSGSIALMFSATNTTLTLKQVRDALIGTTVKKIGPTLRTCGGTSDKVIPNNQFGYGRLDTAAAIAVVKIAVAAEV